ncbi:MAG: hypothetical protein KAF40_00295 [Flavihumibacter sp.]|nr:hypothetical protein [Flavihumibacter sp.]
MKDRTWAKATENFFLIGLTITAIIISDSAWWALLFPLISYDLEKEK